MSFEPTGIVADGQKTIIDTIGNRYLRNFFREVEISVEVHEIYKQLQTTDDDAAFQKVLYPIISPYFSKAIAYISNMSLDQVYEDRNIDTLTTIIETDPLTHITSRLSCFDILNKIDYFIHENGDKLQIFPVLENMLELPSVQMEFEKYYEDCFRALCNYWTNPLEKKGPTLESFFSRNNIDKEAFNNLKFGPKYVQYLDELDKKYMENYQVILNLLNSIWDCFYNTGKQKIAENIVVTDLLKQKTIETLMDLDTVKDELITLKYTEEARAHFAKYKYTREIFNAVVGNYSILKWVEKIFFQTKDDYYDLDKVKWLLDELVNACGNKYHCPQEECTYDALFLFVSNTIPLQKYIDEEKERELLKITQNQFLVNRAKETHEALGELKQEYQSLLYRLIDYAEYPDAQKQEIINNFITYNKESISKDVIKMVTEILRAVVEDAAAKTKIYKKVSDDCVDDLQDLGEDYGYSYKSRIVELGNTPEAVAIVNKELKDTIRFVRNTALTRNKELADDVIVLQNKINGVQQTLFIKQRELENAQDAVNNAEIDKQNAVNKALENTVTKEDAQKAVVSAMNEAKKDKQTEIDELKALIVEYNKNIDAILDESQMNVYTINQASKDLVNLEQLKNKYNKAMEDMQNMSILVEQYKTTETNLNSIIQEKEAKIQELNKQIQKQIEAAMAAVKEKNAEITEKDKKISELEVKDKVRETKLIMEILYNLPINHINDMKDFMKLFFQKIEIVFPGVKMPDPEMTDADKVDILDRSVSEWARIFYEQANKVKREQTVFHIEGILQKDPMRQFEEHEMDNMLEYYLTALKNATEREKVFLSKDEFKKIMLKHCTYNEQREFFAPYMDEPEFENALFGSLPFKEWYNLYLYKAVQIQEQQE